MSNCGKEPMNAVPNWNSTHCVPSPRYGSNQTLDCFMEKNPVYTATSKPKDEVCFATEECASLHIYEAL